MNGLIAFIFIGIILLVTVWWLAYTSHSKDMIFPAVGISLIVIVIMICFIFGWVTI